MADVGNLLVVEIVQAGPSCTVLSVRFPSMPRLNGPDLSTGWSALVRIIRKHFDYSESSEEALVLLVLNKYVAINLCNNYISPARFRYVNPRLLPLEHYCI